MWTRTRSINPSHRVSIQKLLKSGYDRCVQASEEAARHTAWLVTEDAFLASELLRNRLLLDNLTILPPPNSHRVPQELSDELEHLRASVISSEVRDARSRAVRFAYCQGHAAIAGHGWNVIWAAASNDLDRHGHDRSGRRSGYVVGCLFPIAQAPIQVGLG